MGKEIERKFLVLNNDYKKNSTGIFIHQGFLSTDKNRVVRVRIEGKKATLTIKGVSVGIERTEFEYDLPLKDAEQLLSEICIQPTIKKNRFKVEYKSFLWEIDEFLEKNKGLVIAEVELPEVDTIVKLPPWIGTDVSNDPKYYNSNLVKNPYKKWNLF
jgi:adenylate cyclase